MKKSKQLNLHEISKQSLEHASRLISVHKLCGNFMVTNYNI